MTKFLACILFLSLLVGLRAEAAGRRGGGVAAGAGRPSGGFNLNREVPATRPAANPPNRSNVSGNNVNRNVSGNNVNRNASGNNVNRNVSGNTVNTNASNNTVNRNVSNNTVNRNVYGNAVNVNRGVVVANPVYRGPAWGWNHGVAWYPAPGYWGGGFWGAWAIGVTSAAVYGSIVANNVTYTSYQVQQQSPGATLLANYHLTQTQCGPPNLVVIYGPDNSIICAHPNSTVAAGSYNLNASTLSLTS